MKFDSEQTGLLTVFKDYEQMIIEKLVTNPNAFFNSGIIWRDVNARLKQIDPKRSISRASVIFFLKKLDKIEFQNNGEIVKPIITQDTTGKGGHHNLYKATVGMKKLKLLIASHLTLRIAQELTN